MKQARNVIVIGGGLGGLTAAALLAHYGMRVTLVEKNETLGGKLQDVTLGDHRFDFGPSTITMPWIFERVFALCASKVDPQLCFVRLPVHSRNHFHDGTVIQLTSTRDHMDEQLRSCSVADRQGFHRFLVACGDMHRLAEEHFFRRPFTHWDHYVSPALAYALLRVRPWQSMDAFHRQFFQDSRLLAMMNRYATYVGSHPAHTPATMSMIAHMEAVHGVYWIKGGNYTLVEALARLARAQGVRIVTACTVTGIRAEQGIVRGIETAQGERLEADVVVSNVDEMRTQQWISACHHGTPTQKNAFGIKKSPTYSLSGIVTLAAVAKTYPHLSHHNLFYPAQYDQEFVDIFERRRWPTDPTLYVCFSGATDPHRSPHGTNVYLMTNVPPLSDEEISHPEAVRQRAEAYHVQLFDRLEAYGLAEIQSSIHAKQTYSPVDIMERTGAWRGALYGRTSHGMRQTFWRAGIKKRNLQGLYACGGTVHPGGGTPMVVLSGTMAAHAVLRDAGMPAWPL